MAELNVTPLLDLAFVLLIIFIITTPLLESHVPLDLPIGPDHNNQAPDPKSVRTVSIDRTGRVFLDSRPIDLPVLEQELTAFRAQTPDAAVIVCADKSLPYQQVIDVVNVLERAKISRLNLQNVTP
jgi:biopolymer transport protein ExbD